MAIDMEALRAKAKQRNAEKKSPEFVPEELREGNVQAIFNRCGKSNEDGSTEWNEEVLKKNRANIRCLLGQLALVHEGVQEHELDSAFFKKYDGKSWTDNNYPLICLLNMGGKKLLLFFLQKDDKQFAKFIVKLSLTLSPKDPKFTEWWDLADGLMVQAQSATDYKKSDEALAFYEKAAELGNASAQYQCGKMYDKSEGSAKDNAEALKWFQASAKQGHDKAGFFPS